MTLPEWKDRKIERENTFNVLNNKDGTITLIPVTGEIYEAGTPLNALNLNKINAQLETNIRNIDFIKNTELNINFFEGSTKEHRLINMINYAISNGYKKVFVPSGDYDFTGIVTDTILLPESFNKIIIEGENPKTTIFRYANAITNKPFLKIIGGSGQLSKGYIKNIQFVGNSTTVAIENNNVCGFNVDNCIFSTNKIGVLFNNTENGFTEFCVVDNCDFTVDCLSAIEYRKVGTQRSFHGSGLKNCTISQRDSDITSKIMIGEGCLPYNAPLSFSAWTRNGIPLIQNNGLRTSNFYGDILVEPTSQNDINLCSGNSVYLVGGLISHKQTLKLGTLELAYRVQLNDDGNINVHRKPFSRFITTSQTTETTDVIPLSDCETLLIDCRIYTGNYEYNQTLIAFKNVGDNNGKATILSTNRSFDSAGLGSPTWSVTDGKLKITNSKYIGKNVRLQMTVTQIGNRQQNFMC